MDFERGCEAVIMRARRLLEPGGLKGKYTGWMPGKEHPFASSELRRYDTSLVLRSREWG